MPTWVMQYVRIGLYSLFSILGTYGVSVSGGTKEIAISIVGYILTFAWTMWGTRLNGLLAMVKETTGVEEVVIKTDPAKIEPAEVTAGTPPGVTATSA